jgi:hypothetical protein
MLSVFVIVPMEQMLRVVPLTGQLAPLVAQNTTGVPNLLYQQLLLNSQLLDVLTPPVVTPTLLW